MALKQGLSDREEQPEKASEPRLILVPFKPDPYFPVVPLFLNAGGASIGHTAWKNAKTKR